MFISFTGYNQTCRESIKITYDSQVGVRELTGRNDGEDVEKYLKSVGLGIGFSWCGAYCYWVYVQNGVFDGVNSKMAWTPSWFIESKCIYIRGKKNTKPPQIGDPMGIWYESKGRIAHIMFYDGEDDKFYFTNEGNTNDDGSRNGDGVYRKKRIKRQIHSISNWIDKK